MSSPPHKGSNVVKLPPISVKSNERIQEEIRTSKLIGNKYMIKHFIVMMNDKGKLSRDIEEEEEVKVV